jgi:hypothetical protein
LPTVMDVGIILSERFQPETISLDLARETLSGSGLRSEAADFARAPGYG